MPKTLSEKSLVLLLLSFNVVDQIEEETQSIDQVRLVAFQFLENAENRPVRR